MDTFATISTPGTQKSRQSHAPRDSRPLARGRGQAFRWVVGAMLTTAIGLAARPARAQMPPPLCVSPPVASSPSDTCDLGIALDQSSSMRAKRKISPFPRCAFAGAYAIRAYNYWRCGAATCPSGTTSSTLDYSINGAVTNSTVVLSNPANHCSDPSKKRVNVFGFGRVANAPTLPPFRSITHDGGLAPASQNGPGWVSLDSAEANQVEALILANACNIPLGVNTPMADALCGLAPCGAVPSAIKAMKVLTDGGEDASTGVCSGPGGMSPLWLNSWQGNVITVLAVYNWSISTTFFKDGLTLSASSLVATSGTDEQFFQSIQAPGSLPIPVPDDSNTNVSADVIALAATVPAPPAGGGGTGVPSGGVPQAIVLGLLLMGLGGFVVRWRAQRGVDRSSR